MPRARSAKSSHTLVWLPVAALALCACATSPSVGSSSPSSAPASATTASPTAASPSTASAPLQAPAFAVSGRILFSIGREGEPVRLAYIDDWGVHEIPVADDPTIENPVWLDRSSVAFDSEKDGPRHVYRMGINGMGTKLLTRADRWQDTAAVSPDGARLTYATSDPVSHRDLGVAVSSIDGSHEVTVMPTARPGLKNGNGGASWSPDGTKLVYMHITDWDAGRFGLWVMDADGTGAHELTTETTEAFAPRWSPDGTRILFSARPDGAPGYTDSQPLWVVDARGGKPRPLTDPADQGNAFDGDWSPDGKQIVFRYFAPSMASNELRIINADGTGMRTLWTAPTGHFAFTPDWVA